MNVGVILAAGESTRFKSVTHKQYLKLNGKEVIFYSISEMQKANVFDKIIAVVDKEEYGQKYIENKYNITCIEGGNTRNNSIKNALDYVKQNFNATTILFHDCSRPFVKSHYFVEVINSLNDYDAVSTTTEITDSLVTMDGDFVNRRNYLLMQTPEAFHFEQIYDDFDKTSKNTAIISHLKDKSNIKLIKNKEFNFKLTYVEDLFLAEQLMNIDYFKPSLHSKIDETKLGKILLLGGSGGVGQALRKKFESIGAKYFAPTHSQLDLFNVSVSDIEKVCPFKPDIIINVAAAYADDDAGIVETFDKIFNVNVKSNLVLIEYAKKLNKKVNIVVMGSSSSTRGRKNLTNYSATKAALNSIVESQAETLQELGININAVIPEKINTPLIGKLHKTEINTRELLDVDEVIDAVLRCALTKESGQLIHIRKGL